MASFFSTIFNKITTLYDNPEDLVAKCNNDRGNLTNPTGSQESTFRQGIKRPPKRKLVNRPKRLRTSVETTKLPRQKVKSSSGARGKNTLVNVEQVSEDEMDESLMTDDESPVPLEWSMTDDDDEFSVPLTQTWRASNVLNVKSSGHNELNKFKNKFFVVIDTNVFLSHLEIIKNVVTVNITGDIKPVVYIPWMVLEELDFIKNRSKKMNLKSEAQRVNKYIEHTLRCKNERMIGQTIDEANEQKNVGNNPDNKIMACCLQVLEKCQNMILVTGDVNLKNKAHFNNIPVCSHAEIMSKVIALNHTDTLTTITARSRKCIRRSRIQELLMKQCKKSIDDLSAILNKYS